MNIKCYSLLEVRCGQRIESPPALSELLETAETFEKPSLGLSKNTCTIRAVRRCIPARATDEPASAIPVATVSQIVVEVGVEDGAEVGVR